MDARGSPERSAGTSCADDLQAGRVPVAIALRRRCRFVGYDCARGRDRVPWARRGLCWRLSRWRERAGGITPGPHDRVIVRENVDLVAPVAGWPLADRP